jgi:hypothetical protein
MMSPDLTNLDDLDLEEDLFLNNRDITLLSPPPPTTRTVAQKSHSPSRGQGSTGQTGSHSAFKSNSSGQTGAQQAIRRELSSQSGSQMAARSNITSRAGTPIDRHTEYIAKYGQWSKQNQTSNGWDPIQISTTHREWVQRILTGISAFMLSTLSYNLVAHLLSSTQAPLPPNPWFILVLALLVPSATLGAMLVNWNLQWNWHDTIDCLYTGLVSSLVTVAAVRGLWLIGLHDTQPYALLIVLLLTSAIAATIGTSKTISGNIIYGIGWAIAKFRFFFMVPAVLVGGILGYVLTIDFTNACLLPFGILLGMGIAAALIWRVEQLMKQNQVQH